MVPSIILTSPHWRWSLPGSHWWLNRREFLNEDTLRPQRGICCNPICTPEDAEDVCRPQCVCVCVCVWGGYCWLAVRLFWGLAVYIWQHWLSKMMEGKLAFPVGLHACVINPQRRKRLLGCLCVSSHTCMHVFLQRMGVQVTLWWYLGPSFVRNPASLSQSVASWKCLGVPIWTLCVFWRWSGSGRVKML